MASIEALRRSLELLDPDGLLKGISYEQTWNKSLGLSDASDFHVGVPYTAWPANRSEAPKEFESVIAIAIKDTLADGIKASTTTSEHVIIDLTQLSTGGWPEFFASKSPDGENLAQSFGRIVSSLPAAITPVIRILLGLNNEKSAQQTWEEILRPEMEKVFWPGGQSVFSHANVQLYIGFYSPSFTASRDDVLATHLKDEISPLVDVVRQMAGNLRASLYPFLSPDMKERVDDVTDMLIGDSLVDNIAATGFLGICWNHAKILAVDGQALMTGGALYYPYYGDGQAWISDMQAKLKGDATLSAHAYCDYIWSYLNSDHPTDRHSFRWHSKAGVNSKPIWDNHERASLFGQRSRTQDGYTVLTVHRLGDMNGSNQTLRYPIQIIDAIRDLVVNLLWHLIQIRAPHFLWAFETMVLSTFSDQNLVQSMRATNTSPAAWASRIARCKAIELAQHQVYIDTDTIACCLHRDDNDWKKQRRSINDVLGLFGEEEWDGNVWPYDLLAALAGFMRRIEEGDDRAVNILLTAPLLDGREYTGWEDPLPLDEFKKRIRAMTQLPMTGDEAQYNEWFNARCKIKRMSNDASWSNHCKVVCIDCQLLYVGSDNIYPSYNTEHGIWVDDKTAIDRWYNGYWKPRWQTAPQAF